MKNWEDFEIKTTEFLNKTFGENANFEHLGASDSTVADIKVTTNNDKVFYIEAKHSPAQCGQFVLLPNIETHTFDYSKLNAVPINTYSKQIIDFMNQDFDSFKEAGTKGKEIIMANGAEIFSNWIIDFYKNKNVKFFITNENLILPIEKFSDYFNVKAKFRVKRSGSSSVGSCNLKKITDYINKNFNQTKIEVVGDKLFVSSSNQLHNLRFVYDGFEYMFSQREDKYEIRKLSNTFNANVIFSIELKSGVSGISIKDFVLFLIAY